MRTLFSVISNTWIHCFRSNQSVNKRTIRIHTLTERDREETVNGKFSVIPPASGVSKRAKNLLNSSGVKGCP